MRKTVAVTMAIVVMSLVGMMFAANVALKPYQQYARIGRELTTILEMRRDIREGTTVFTLAKVATDKRLADDGWGMLIELTPSDRVKTKPGSMEKLAYRVAREAADLYRQSRGKPLEWFEIKMDLGADVYERTLIRISRDGRLGRPEPRLSVKYP